MLALPVECFISDCMGARHARFLGSEFFFAAVFFAAAYGFYRRFGRRAPPFLSTVLTAGLCAGFPRAFSSAVGVGKPAVYFQKFFGKIIAA